MLMLYSVINFVHLFIGPLVMINIMGQRICIINSAKVATDLLDTRSSIYSDRPAMPMVKELCVVTILSVKVSNYLTAWDGILMWVFSRMVRRTRKLVSSFTTASMPMHRSNTYLSKW